LPRGVLLRVATGAGCRSNVHGGGWSGPRRGRGRRPVRGQPPPRAGCQHHDCREPCPKHRDTPPGRQRAGGRRRSGCRLEGRSGLRPERSLAAAGQGALGLGPETSASSGNPTFRPGASVTRPRPRGPMAPSSLQIEDDFLHPAREGIGRLLLVRQVTTLLRFVPLPISWAQPSSDARALRPASAATEVPAIPRSRTATRGSDAIDPVPGSRATSPPQ
jgi:hypothetical protein